MDQGTLGNGLLVLAAVAALASIVSIAAGRKDGVSARRLGALLTFAVLGFSSLATLLIVVGFLTENWALQYVVLQHPTVTGPTAWLYRMSAIWAGREGSLLFWQWCIAIFAAWAAAKTLKRDDLLGSTGLAVINFVQLFFLVALFVDLNNPFKLTPPGWVDPNTGALLTSAAMNPLLQTWAMFVHPPTTFIGFAGFTVAFAFAVAALITGDTSKSWVTYSDRATILAWLMLSIGNGTGSIWAYIELAFGGYWAWDPVENASMLPWFTGVALIHSMTVYRRRGGLKAWTFMLAAASFAFSILATFIVRSGVVQSVHAFQDDPSSFWLFLGMVAFSLSVVAIGVVMRWKQLQSDSDGFERMVSKEGSYYFNNVIMLISSLLVAYLTLSTAFPTWMPLGGQSIKPAAYDAIARPLGILYILVMTICPILAWGGGDWRKLWERGRMPAIIGSAIAAVFMVLYFTVMLPFYTPDGLSPVWWHHFISIAGLVTAGFAIGLPVWLFIEGARARAASVGTSFASALGWIIIRMRTQSGGYIAHLGMGVVLLGLVGSVMFVRTHQVVFPQTPGATYQAGDYTLTYVGLEETRENIRGGTSDTVYTLVANVSENGRHIQQMRPQLRFPQQLADRNQSTQRIALVMEPFKDIYVSFSGLDDANNANLTLRFFPMQIWVWIGFGIVMLGAALAAWPKRHRAA